MGSSGGNTISYWRQLGQLRNFVIKSYPSLSAESLQNNIVGLLRLTRKGNSDNENAPFSHKNEKEMESQEKVDSSSNQNYRTSYSEVMKALTSLNVYLPQLPYTSSSAKEADSTKEIAQNVAPPKWLSKKKDLVSRASIDSRTRHLIQGLEPGLSISVTLRRIEDLCIHLKKYPETRGVAIKYSGIPRLLRVVHQADASDTVESAREALALIGYTDPVRGHGIRILSIDGGGIRGLVALNILRQIESKTGHRIHELFDFVCGVSTGAVLAVLLSWHRLSLDDCEKLYRDISFKIFSQTTFKGTASLVLTNSFYDSLAWTEILKKEMGHTRMIESQRTAKMNKICLVATQTNDSWVKAFLFRNYNFPYRMASHFNGCSSARMWEGVRASAAAPGYFSEFKLKDLVLLDGGVMVNNPTAIAMHEARQLWPDTPFQSIVSIGTGRHEPLAVEKEFSINWTSKIKTIINSATDTEGVHTTLHDLLPGNVYFRFNPYLSEALNLDEIREEKLACMLEDTDLYVRKNEAKLDGAVKSLKNSKTVLDQIHDYVSLKRTLWDF